MDLQNGGYFANFLKSRIKENKNFICAITGQTGSGKSWAALSLGEYLDPNFTIDNVCFTPRDFMRLVNGEKKKLVPGSVIVFDEFQISMSNMEHQSLQAKLLNYVLQTFRHKNFILIITTPYFSFVNAGARKLFHSRMETLDIDYKKSLVRIKPLLLQVNQDTGDVYRKYLPITFENGDEFAVEDMILKRPSEQLAKEYDIIKDNFTKELNKEVQIALDKIDKKEKIDTNALTDVQQKVLDCFKDKLNVEQIAKKLNKTDNAVWATMVHLRKKGYKFEPVKEFRRIKYYLITSINDNPACV